ncbi:MAG: cobalt ECF transporter T component CbiQ [Acidimicrobiia bacterium]|nr:cobalt ECF transporter T component CbiQ [Acidimicrobiia bacterium]
MSGGHAHTLHIHGHSVAHRMAPHLKVAALGIFVVAVVATPARAVPAFGVYAILLGTVAAVSGVPVRFIVRRMVIEVPFLLFAVLLPFVGSAPYLSLGGLRVSEAGLLAAWTIVAKGSCGVVASILLAATTEVPEILTGLQRLRVPAPLVAIAGFMVRYLEVIAGELSRMRVAMAARGYEARFLWQAKVLATSAGALFIRSYERGERVYLAMVSRGYTGTMPVFAAQGVTRRDYVQAFALPAIAVVVALAGWVVVA